MRHPQAREKLLGGRDRVDAGGGTRARGCWANTRKRSRERVRHIPPEAESFPSRRQPSGGQDIGGGGGSKCRKGQEAGPDAGVQRRTGS